MNDEKTKLFISYKFLKDGNYNGVFTIHKIKSNKGKIKLEDIYNLIATIIIEEKPDNGILKNLTMRR